jgi:hypothetical protein
MAAWDWEGVHRYHLPKSTVPKPSRGAGLCDRYSPEVGAVSMPGVTTRDNEAVWLAQLAEMPL